MTPKLFIAPVAALWLVAFSYPVKAEIKIGVAVPLSGSFQSLGGQILAGADFSAKRLNQQGGVSGDTITLEPIDDKCAVEGASDIANQLVGKGVVAVIGHLCDRLSIEAAAVYAKNRIVQISPASENPAFTENRPLKTGGTYRLAPRNTVQADLLSRFLIALPKNAKIALVDDGSLYGKGLTDPIAEYLKAKDRPPVLRDSFESGEERYRVLSSRLADSGASHVLIGANHQDSATLIRDLDRLSSTITVLGGDAMVHRDFPALVLADNQNRTSLERLIVSFPADPRHFASAAEVVAAFKKAAIEPVGLTLAGYSALDILAKAIQTAGTTDFDKLNAVLNKTEFKTPLGPIRFDSKGDANLTGYALHQWQNDTIIPIKSTKP